MAIREFLAHQEASFVSLNVLLEQIEATNSCSSQDAAKVLARCLAQAGADAPAWHTFSDAIGPTLVTVPASIACANFTLEELTCDESSRAYDPRVPFETIMTQDLADEEYRGIYVLVWQAYRECGFLTREIYPVLRDTITGIQLPDAGGASEKPMPLTLEEKREIVRLRGRGKSALEIAAQFKKSASTIHAVLRNAKEKPTPLDLTILSRRR